MPSNQRRLQVNSHVRAHHAIYTDCLHPLEACFTEISIALILAGTAAALWRLLCNTVLEVLVRTQALLRNVCQRVMITPVSHLRTRFIYIIPSYFTNHRSFEIIFEWEQSIGLEFKFNVLIYANPLLQRNIQFDINNIFKNI